MNGLTYKLEYLERNVLEKIDCFKIDDYDSEENSIRIKIATNSFIPQNLSFYFSEERNVSQLSAHVWSSTGIL